MGANGGYWGSMGANGSYWGLMEAIWGLYGG